MVRRLVKAMVFLVFMYGCESWTIKKAECRRIDAFELWCWTVWTVVLEKTLESPLDCKEIQPVHPKGDQSRVCSLEGLMLKLKLQSFGHLMWTADSLEKTLIPGKIEGKRRTGWQDEMVEWHHWLSRHESVHTLGDSEGQGSLMCCSSWGLKDRTWLSDWTTT